VKLAGAVAVVTGGGSGLGAALGRQLAAAGAVPVILDLRPERVDRLVGELERARAQVAGWVCDVADRGQVEATFAAIEARFGRVDLLVNCAGRSMLRPFLEMSDDDLDWVLGPNLLGVVHTIRAAARRMPRGSRIVNVSSVSGRVPTPGEAFYSAAKAAVVSLSESLAAELASRGIGSTLVLPGEMSTALFAEHPSWELRPDFQRRMEQPPERVARAIVRALRSDRFEVVSPRSMRAVLLLQRVAPRLFRRGIGWYYTRLLEPRIAGGGAS
jgi:NAD(P)-dependent dehydrogenase (short-subunit alcohol dehydrogenase family)